MVDAHIHQWDPFTTPRLVSGPAKVIRRAPFLAPLLMRVFPRSAREFAGDPQYLLNRYLPDDYAADAAPAPVAAIVHVEAGWQGKRPVDCVDETRWVAPCRSARPGCRAWTRSSCTPIRPSRRWPMCSTSICGRVLWCGARGARLRTAPTPGIMDFANRPNLLSEPAFLRGFGAVAERGLSFEIWLYGHQLPDAVTLAGEYPETTFVLNHYATPIGALAPCGRHTGSAAAERKDILRRWRDDISALAALPNVVAKHSGLGMPVLGLGHLERDELADAVAPLITHLGEAFGPQRTFWSSNYPIDKPNLALPESIWIPREVLGEGFDENLMLRENARRVYRI